MKKNNLCYDQIQNKFVDTLIGLAIEQMDAIETQDLIDNYGEEWDTDLEGIFSSSYPRIQNIILQERKKRKTKAIIQKVRMALPKMIEIAAIVVIVIGIAVPVAIANVSSIRMKVMELLLTFEEDHVEAELRENDDAHFYVPAEWHGDYFPSYLPEGFEFTYLSSTGSFFSMKNSEGKEIYFQELSENGSGNYDTTDAVLSYVELHNKQALLIEKNDVSTVFWEMDNRLFYVVTTISKDETIKIAESVEKISR